MSESRLRGIGGCRAVCVMVFGLNVLVGMWFPAWFGLLCLLLFFPWASKCAL